MRNCIAAAGSRSLKKRVARIMEPVFRAKDTNHKIKRRTKVVQVFPSQKSLMRLVGSVLAEQDEI
jgi:transposase-like protein